MTDYVNQPPHYNQHPSGVEAIQITEHFSFCVGNAIKYVFRAGKKMNNVEDLRKAVWYAERAMSDWEGNYSGVVRDGVVLPLTRFVAMEKEEWRAKSVFHLATGNPGVAISHILREIRRLEGLPVDSIDSVNGAYD